MLRLEVVGKGRLTAGFSLRTQRSEFVASLSQELVFVNGRG